MYESKRYQRSHTKSARMKNLDPENNETIPNFKGYSSLAK